jgi:hypothetical protein
MGQKLTRYATTEKAITLADSPYTASPNFNCIKVNTAGGNVRVNLPTVDYPIDVIKTSSDTYIVTVWVAGTQIGEVAGELSSVTVESGQITKDEPWYPYDYRVSLLGVPGDGGEICAFDKHNRCVLRDVSWSDDSGVINSTISLLPNGGSVYLSHGTYVAESPIHMNTSLNIELFGQSNYHGYSNYDAVNATKILKHFNGNLIDMVFSDYTISGSYIHDLTFIGLHSGYYSGYNTGSAIYITKSTCHRISNIHTVSFETGMSLISAGVGRYDNLWLEECSYDGLYIEDTWDTIIDALESCNVLQSSGYASVNIVSGNIILNNAHLEGNIGLKMTGGNLQATNIFIPFSIKNNVYLKNAYLRCNNLYLYGGNSNNDQAGIDAYSMYLDGGVSATMGVAYIDISASHATKSIACNTGGAANFIYATNVIANRPCTIHGRSLFTSCFFDGAITAYDNNIFSACDFNAGIQHFGSATHCLGGVLAVGVIGEIGTDCKMIAVAGYATENSGSSTGTGSEQTIAHSLAAIPTGCKAWIKIEYPIGSGRYITKDIPYDATNVYPTVDNGVAFEWGIA